MSPTRLVAVALQVVHETLGVLEDVVDLLRAELEALARAGGLLGHLLDRERLQSAGVGAAGRLLEGVRVLRIVGLLLARLGLDLGDLLLITGRHLWLRATSARRGPLGHRPLPTSTPRGAPIQEHTEPITRMGAEQGNSLLRQCGEQRKITRTEQRRAGRYVPV